jgi:Holliday junction resolvasome RuvABC endonuclease subunit
VSRTVYSAAVTAAPLFPRSHNQPPGGVLAWDLSRWCGWSYGHIGDGEPTFGTVKLGDSVEAARLCAFEEHVEDLIAKMQPGHLVLEAPLPLPAHNSLSVTAQQLTLDRLARMAAWRASVPVFSIDPATVRRDVLGRGWFSKDKVKLEVMRFCRRRGWQVQTHHEADACLVWLWYCRQRQGVRPAAGPLFAEAVA